MRLLIFSFLKKKKWNKQNKNINFIIKIIIYYRVIECQRKYFKSNCFDVSTTPNIYNVNIFFFNANNFHDWKSRIFPLDCFQTHEDAFAVSTKMTLR